MWPWIKRWRDWLVREIWPMTRTSPQSQALYFSYEKGGLTVADQPIPWNAEAVLVEALLRLPPGVSRRKGDFTLRCPDRESVAARPASPSGGRGPLSPDLPHRSAEDDDGSPGLLSRPRPGRGQAAVPEPGRIHRQSAAADADVVCAHGRRDRGLSDLRGDAMSRSGRRRIADESDESGAAARPGAAGRVSLRARRSFVASAGLSGQFAAGRPAGAADGGTAASSAPPRRLDGDLDAGRSSLGQPTSPWAFPRPSSAVRCDFRTRGSWSRRPMGRCN